MFALLDVGLLVGGWHAVYVSSCKGGVATDGLYGVVRLSQCSGIMLGVFRQIVHWPTIVPRALFSVVVLAYVRLARKEEREMIRRFGTACEAYLRQAPMFLPRWGQCGQWGNFSIR